MTLFEINKNYKENILEKHIYIDNMSNVHLLLHEYSKYINNTDIKSIKILDGFIIFEFKSEKILLKQNVFDKRAVPYEILNFENYEKTDYNFFIKIITYIYNSLKIKKCFFIDIGGNIGWYSLNISSKFKNIESLAIEPIQYTYNTLQENIKINKLEKKIKSFNLGFSDKKGFLDFYYDKNFTSSASMKNITKNTNSELIRCNVELLDEFANNLDKNIEFIKIDTEGSELFVIKGGIKTIEKNRPFIMVEMLRKWSAEFNYHPNEIIELLKDIGYKCFANENNKVEEIFLINENTIPTNFFFLHNKKHKKQIENIFSF
ncbi:MAG: FkbM family methyltransferase [Cyanobacteriota bacterium]